jgi:DEAD/DEAH box helicase domain-containing protein
VSRRRAASLLAHILERRTSLKAVASIGEAPAANALFDSELERRFIEALRRRPVDGSVRFDVKEEVVRGKPGYLLNADGHIWSIEPQVELGPTQGVSIPCKPDFVFWSENDSQRPIAVFLDGWRYHKDRIGDDMAKRMAVARSGRFDVWSLTSDDIAHVLDQGARLPETLWPALFADVAQTQGPVYERFGVADLQRFHSLTAFEQLRRILLGMPDASRIRLAVVLGVRASAVAISAEAFDTMRTSPAADVLVGAPPFAWKVHPELGRTWTAAIGGLHLVAQSVRSELAQLASSPEDRSFQPLLILRWMAPATLTDEDRRRLWQQLWQAANLLLPAAGTWLVADEGCALSPLAHSPAYQPRMQGSAQWQEACELVHPGLAGVLAGLAMREVPVPVVGYEFMDTTGCVVAEAEVAWPTHRLAICLVRGSGQPLSDASWTVLHADDQDLENLLMEALTR